LYEDQNCLIKNGRAETDNKRQSQPALVYLLIFCCYCLASHFMQFSEHRYM